MPYLTIERKKDDIKALLNRLKREVNTYLKARINNSETDKALSKQILEDILDLQKCVSTPFEEIPKQKEQYRT